MFGLKVYTLLNGRIGRLKWWLSFTLLTIAFFIAAFPVSFMLFPAKRGSTAETVSISILIVLLAVYFGANFLIAIKRLHDTDNSGWWLLLLLVPYIGWLLLIYFLGFKKGTIGNNKFGDNSIQ